MTDLAVDTRTLPLLREAAAGSWELVAGEEVLATHPDYPAAVAALAAMVVPITPSADEEQGLLAETWTSERGIAFNEQPDPERDFTNAEWSWRDPAEALLPLMLQTSTQIAHFEAELAGFITKLWMANGAPQAAGRFYDSEAGAQARDILLGGRRFGVSVDPGAETAADFLCLDEEDGFCMEGKWDFTQYQIAGLTMTPFPAFELASIQLADPAGGEDATSGTSDEEGLAASAGAAELVEDLRAVPPMSFFTMAEPEWGDPLLEQQDPGGTRWGVPLTITAEGQVFGHLALWGECLRGRADVCIQPPESASAYSEFHCSPGVMTAEGIQLSTGPLIVGCAHYPTSGVDRSAHQLVRDFYAEAGMGWADVRVTSGEFGPWMAGRVRPDVTPAQLSVIRSLAVSGDWNLGPEGMELCAVLSVNKPGFPVRREAITAAALPAEAILMEQPVRASLRGGQLVALTGANRVRHCPECAKRAKAARAARAGLPPSISQLQLDRIEAKLEVLDKRTAHLRGPALSAALQKLSGASLV